MSTKVSNLALRHLGNSNEIADFLTERSQEARAARAFYEIARDETLRDCALPVSRRRIQLALVSTNPNEEYLYAYRVPSDNLAIRGVALTSLAGYYSNGMSQPLYKISSDDSGALILSNIANMGIEYIARITNIDILPHDFVMALSYKLAYYMAPSITGGDPFKRAPICAQSYDVWIDKAKVNAYNEEPGPQAMASELVNAHFYAVDDVGFPINGRVA